MDSITNVLWTIQCVCECFVASTGGGQYYKCFVNDPVCLWAFCNMHMQVVEKSAVFSEQLWHTLSTAQLVFCEQPSIFWSWKNKTTNFVLGQVVDSITNVLWTIQCVCERFVAYMYTGGGQYYKCFVNDPVYLWAFCSIHSITNVSWMIQCVCERFVASKGGGQYYKCFVNDPVCLWTFCSIHRWWTVL